MKIQLSELRKIIRKTIKEANIGVTRPMSGLAGPMMTGGGAEQPTASELNKFAFILGRAIDIHEEQKAYNPKAKFVGTLETELKTEKDLGQKVKNYIRSSEDPETLFQEVPGIQEHIRELLDWSDLA